MTKQCREDLVSDQVPKYFKKIDARFALELRIVTNLNQRDFWGLVGVTQSGGSRYESGRTIPLAVKALVATVFQNEVKKHPGLLK